METGLFVDKGPEFMVPSMKRGVFMDKWPVLEDLSMKRGVFMDEYGRFCVRCGSIRHDSVPADQKSEEMTASEMKNRFSGMRMRESEVLTRLPSARAASTADAWQFAIR